MAKPKLFVVGFDGSYSKPWNSLFDVVKNFRAADVVLFTGGSDVSPHLYGEEEGRFTRPFPRRDWVERRFFNNAVERKLGMIGICRGAQFITVMNGGSLVQHVSHHGSWHFIRTKDDEFVTSSTHHQMMNPYDLDPKDYSILGWADQLSHTYMDGQDRQVPRFWKPGTKEPEVVFYPKIRALAIQGHPEIMQVSSPGVQQFHKWTKELIL